MSLFNIMIELILGLVSLLIIICGSFIIASLHPCPPVGSGGGRGKAIYWLRPSVKIK
jgi:hypothetical protein